MEVEGLCGKTLLSDQVFWKMIADDWWLKEAIFHSTGLKLFQQVIMVFCEDCILRLGREEKLPLMPFSRAQHCIFWEVKWVPLVLSVVSRTPIWRRSVWARPSTVALVNAETVVTLIYTVGNSEARKCQNSFTTKGQLVGNHRRVCKHGGWSQSLVSAKMTAWCVWSVVWTLKCHPLKGCSS